MHYYDELDLAFRAAKERARVFVLAYNEALPTSRCPKCKVHGHVPGLPCPDCGYIHKCAYLLVRDTEFGYAAVPLNNQRKEFAIFNVNID